MLATSASGTPPVWTATTSAALADDDLARHSQDPAYLDGLALTSLSFSENGFAWQLLRFDNLAKPDGPLWVVPHDDENAAFEAVIAALRLHGGRAIVVNSSGSLRRQSGSGRCGVRSGIVSACDPNRNFAADAPLFTVWMKPPALDSRLPLVSGAACAEPAKLAATKREKPIDFMQSPDAQRACLATDDPC